MSSQLETLLDLRRATERSAEAALAHAVVEREREDGLQAELVGAWQTARQAAVEARGTAAPAPATAGAALHREHYLGELERRATRAAEQARAHRDGRLAASRQAEEQARAAHERARRERETAEQLAERARAESAKGEAQRAAASADELAMAAYLRRREDR